MYSGIPWAEKGRVLQVKTLCIYHANCADGLGAAWAVYRALGDNVEFHAASYGDNPVGSIGNGAGGWFFPISTEIANRDILIVDFSYPLPVLRAMAAEARSVLVLDHHKTAQEDLTTLEPFCGCEIEYRNPSYSEILQAISTGDTDANLFAIFDLNRSGAGLTWDYLHPNVPRPRIIDLIEDRDFKYDPETRQFHAALMSYDWGDLTTPCYGFNNVFQMLDCWNEWSTIAESRKREMESGPAHDLDPSAAACSWYDILQEGSTILRAQPQLVASILRAARRTMKITGHIVPVANVPAALASEAGDALCQSSILVDHVTYVSHNPDLPKVVFTTDGICSDNIRPLFVATYYDGADGKRHFSLRSPEGGADVSLIAKKYGGGGHHRAAGFAVALGWEGDE